MEYYSAVKRNNTDTLYKTWVNLKDILLSEKRHSQKDPYYIITFIQHLRNNNYREMEISGYPAVREGKQKSLQLQSSTARSLAVMVGLCILTVVIVTQNYTSNKIPQAHTRLQV